MPHIHELIDFTVSAYIAHNSKVLLVDHIKLKTWMPIGGHVELDEDPEEALYREVKEECGLDVTVVGEKPKIQEQGVKPLIPPTYLDIHDITDTHKHIGMVYLATTDTDEVKLAEGEHHDIRWFSQEDLANPTLAIRPFVQFYSRAALAAVRLHAAEHARNVSI